MGGNTLMGSSIHLTMETIPLPETLYFDLFGIRMMGKFRKQSDSDTNERKCSDRC
jgi:hypothetical protein